MLLTQVKQIELQESFTWMIAMKVEGSGGPARTFLQAMVMFLSMMALSFISWHQVSLANSMMTSDLCSSNSVRDPSDSIGDDRTNG